jgi:hypothetical protein
MSVRATLGQFAPSTLANSGSAPSVFWYRWRAWAGVKLIACEAMWHVEQLRPLLPRL